MDWHDAAHALYERTFSHEDTLSTLAEEWQRELVALMLVNDEVNNGAYLQFISNHGREMYVYASRALKKIGALQMLSIVDRCQALVDEHFPLEGKSYEERGRLLPNVILDREGNAVKEAGSVLPQSVLDRISELSYEFMGYPDNIADLAQRFYGSLIADVR